MYTAKEMMARACTTGPSGTGNGLTIFTETSSFALLALGRLMIARCRRG